MKMWNLFNFLYPKEETSGLIDDEFLNSVKEAYKEDLYEMILILMKEYESRK